MAFKIILFHVFTALVAVNLIFAQEESDRFFGLPFFGGSGGGNNNSSGAPSLPFLGFFGNSQLPSIFNVLSRQERSAEPQEDDEGGQQERLFFGSLVSCNYTAQGGTNCVSCRQSLACYPNNIGRLRTCRGFLRYCNNGRCSFSPGPLCSSGNSTSG